MYEKQVRMFYIWLMTMKMRLKMKYRSHRYNITKTRPRHGHKQHLINIWSSIHKKVWEHWGWVEKKVLLTKKGCN